MRRDIIPTLLATALLAAPALAQDGAAPQSRIASGFAALGMPEARADCFGEVIGEKLEGDDLERAAEIVRTAEASEDVRQAVSEAGLVFMDAFSAANNECRRWGREG